MVYKAVLFDLDGTLLDTLRDIADAANAALAKLGLPTHELPEYRYFVGEGMAALAFKVLPDTCRDKNTVAKLLKMITKEYDARWAIHTRPYPGIPELLDALVARGMKIAVLSNKPHEFTTANVERLLPRWNFNAVVGASATRPRKPDPAGALEIARKLGMPTEDFLYLGDTAIDMQTATAAGMHPVGALWGFRDKDELLASGAKALINRPEELLLLIG